MSTTQMGSAQGRARWKVWLFGALALAAVLGGYWYFNTAGSGGARPL